jgi:hypothetical protein
MIRMMRGEYLRACRLPPPLGQRVAQFPPPTDCKAGGWHGSDLNLWREQLEKGVVYNQGDLYLGTLSQALSYALLHKNPVLIRLSVDKGIVQMDEVFHTFFVRSPSKVLLHEAHLVNEEFIRQQRLGIFERHRRALHAAITAMQSQAYPQHH